MGLGYRRQASLYRHHQQRLQDWPMQPSGIIATGGMWSALDPATGKILWQTAEPTGSWAFGLVSVANGVVHAGAMDPKGYMRACAAATGKFSGPSRRAVRWLAVRRLPRYGLLGIGISTSELPDGVLCVRTCNASTHCAGKRPEMSEKREGCSQFRSCVLKSDVYRRIEIHFRSVKTSLRWKPCA
jgi:hypothetical protein